MLLYLRARVPIPFDVFICQTSTRCSLHSKCEKDLSIGGEKKENTRTLRERKKMEMEALTRGILCGSDLWQSFFARANANCCYIAADEEGNGRSLEGGEKA